MATFVTQIQDYVGTVSDTVALDGWLTDGAKDVINAVPANKLSLFATQSTFTSTAAGSESESIATGKVLHCFRNDGTIDQPCRNIQSLLKGRASDSAEMEYASSTDPVYYIENGKINALPASGSCKYSIVQLPTVANTDSSISNFPDDAEHLVVLYASAKAARRQALDAVERFPTDLDADTTVFDVITDLEISIATLDFPTKIDLSSEVTNLIGLIDTDEDAELVSAKIAEMNMQLNEISTELGNEIKRMGVEEREYAQNLAKSLQLYTAKLNKEGGLVTHYVALAQSLDADYKNGLKQFVAGI